MADCSKTIPNIHARWRIFLENINYVCREIGIRFPAQIMVKPVNSFNFAKNWMSMDLQKFRKSILKGIPEEIPPPYTFEPDKINHAPVRKDILSVKEKKLAIINALRYFPANFHETLVAEFAKELESYGRIYMYRFKPGYRIYARPLSDYPCRTRNAAAIMHMISNNLDEQVAQHPHELITYGGNGAVFQNWAQYLITMKYLAIMTDEQTLVLNSGHPLGLFPSHKEAPRLVISNGMVVPNYSKPEDYEKFNALGVSQYGQMTAGSFMYIGPQGIVHGTTLTILNAGRKRAGKNIGNLRGMLYVSSGLGGMSGAQPKATVIAGGICLIAEINPAVVRKRFEQGWVDEVYEDLEQAVNRVKTAHETDESVSVVFQGNVVDLWERLAELNFPVNLGSDQTSLHNPYSGGYYPVGLSLAESNGLMVSDPEKFREMVRASLRRQVDAINRLALRGMYFWDYGNAFLLEAGRAGANVFNTNGDFRYTSYVQDIMGPMFFDYGFGPFRWVCTSADPHDLEISDKIAEKVLQELYQQSPKEISMQMHDNLLWIREAGKNKLVVGSQARILYADCQGRIRIAEAFNRAIREGMISAPVVLGRDHHDVSGTDSPFRETSDIYDGSRFTADMAVQNVIGDSFRGASWVSLHNGGGVGWGEAINGGFGMILDGSEQTDKKIQLMLHWDVNNGIARRSWARNEAALVTIKREMKRNGNLEVTLPNLVDNRLIDRLF
jgi:urocanate hydratase